MHKCLTLFLLFCSIFASAQAEDDKTLTIPAIDRPPTLADFAGMKPSEAIKKKMSMVSGFIQQEPADGKPATHDTHVYMAYDAKHLYAVFLAFDSEPEKIRARMSPRENVFSDDYVDIQIDTFNDQRRAYTFLATPLGIQWDALWTEGQDFDDSYQAVWRSDGKITDKGYMILFSIPFSSLRFPATSEQTWGLLLNRTIPRLSEESFWPAYTNRIEGRLNQAGTLKGVKDISPGRNIMLNPYGFARNFRILDPDTATFNEEDFDPELGLDAKMVIKDSFVLDLTVNPDFSQVESDQPQVTVNERFEVFFPEKRPFFLENADFFNTFTNLVFTRRIIDPNAGLRFTGKKGKYGLGVMLIDDEAPGQNREADDPLSGETAKIGIVRVSRDISAQSTMGVLFTNREFGDNYNRVGGLDGRLKLNDNWIAQFQSAFSETKKEDQTLNGASHQIMVNRSGRHLNIHNHFLRTGSGFATQLGFLGGEQRPNSMNLHNRTGYTFRPEGKALVEWEIAGRIGQTWDADGHSLDTFTDPEISWKWAGDSNLGVSYQYSKQTLTPEEFSGLLADTELTEATYEIEFSSDYFSLISFNLEYEFGQGVNFVPADGKPPEEVDTKSIEAGFTLRPLSQLRWDANYFYVTLDDQSGAGRIFDNEILRSRINWQFTRELSLRLIYQTETTDPDEGLTRLETSKNRNTDLLLRYILNPWTALYLGYNSNESNFQIIETENGRQVIPTLKELNRDGKQYFLKFSYLFQF